MIERLLRDGTVIARSDGTAHDLYPAARHVVVDPYQATRFAKCGLQVLEEAGVASLVEHHVEESQIALRRFLSEGRRFELPFVGDYQLRRSPVRRRSA